MRDGYLTGPEKYLSLTPGTRLALQPFRAVAPSLGVLRAGALTQRALGAVRWRVVSTARLSFGSPETTSVHLIAFHADSVIQITVAPR